MESLIADFVLYSCTIAKVFVFWEGNGLEAQCWDFSEISSGPKG